MRVTALEGKLRCKTRLTNRDPPRDPPGIPTNPGSGKTPSSGPPAYAVIGLLVALLLLGTGTFLWLDGRAGEPVVGGPFTLTDGSGRTVTDGDFRGKYLLVYFGYTYCPDVCPTTLNAEADALDRLGKKADLLRPVFITVDPRRDTPAVIKQYQRRSRRVCWG